MDGSDEEDHWDNSAPPAPYLGPEASSSENSVGANMTNVSAGPKGALGLSFSGGSGSMTSLSWRDARFSDWTVQVGEKFYHLHAFLLARASLFFESHMSIAARAEQGNAKGSDLTEVLPTSCHSAFEDALDFMYSENQAAFEAPASKALLLLKIADILQISSLFEAMGRRIEAAFEDTAPLLLEQYCRFHIPGTDDGAALRQIRDGAVDLIVRKFQPFLTNAEMKTALLRLPARVLVEILQADELLVASEDVVFDFVLSRLHGELESDGPNGPNEKDPRPSDGEKASTPERQDGEDSDDEEALWDQVRWAFLSSTKFAQALALGNSLLKPEVTQRALTVRTTRFDLGGAEAFGSMGYMNSLVPRRPILPPGVPPPTSTEIDFCFHYAHSEQYACGEALRSQPKRIGDVVLRVLVFPAGTDTGVARGSLSVFLEAVPQPSWPRDWEFANIRYGIACIRWPSGSGETWAAKKKSDLWTFKANRLDRGWHDFLAPGEIHRYLGPDGFVCIRGSLEQECLGRAFLLNQASQAGYSGGVGDAAGSSASRRSWVPRSHPMSEQQ
ncbi:unnamed protein product [Cladocopium goreaui]|uniref:BTB domain-containing protein n=1 Tax=Cladocopium goreaui TaxID=2562237 RepID=A0A9P1CKM0_9DINO|nr:unnamed protein product [Cladocopium goreaui]